MCQILKVTGNSLFPLIQEGDFVLVFKIPFLFSRFFQYKKGDIVVLKHPYYGVLIKKIDWLSADGKQSFVIGNHAESTDSRQFGLVENSWISGKVVFHIQKPGREENSG
mgnify:FL=1